MQPGRKTYSELEAMVNRKVGQVVDESRSHDDYLQWTIEHGAIELLGDRELTPWDAGTFEQCVRFTGTMPLSTQPGDVLPGIPLTWLCEGGREGNDERLKVKAGRTLEKRMRELREALEGKEWKSKGITFRICQLPKSEYGVVAFYTQATAKPVQFAAHVPQKPAAQFIRVGR